MTENNEIHEIEIADPTDETVTIATVSGLTDEEVEVKADEVLASTYPEIDEG